MLGVADGLNAGVQTAALTSIDGVDTWLTLAHKRKCPATYLVAGHPVAMRLIWLLDLGSNQGPTD
jgi:hypothetical protein